MKKIFYIYTLLSSYILCTAMSIMSTTETETITLISSDETIVSRDVAELSGTIKNLLNTEKGEDEKEGIPLAMVSSKILKKIIEDLHTIVYGTTTGEAKARKHIDGNGYVTQDLQNIINESLKGKDSKKLSSNLLKNMLLYNKG